MAPSSRRVQAMFAAIAPQYDLLNRVLSCGADRSWRRRAARGLGVGPGARVLDLCCGTGDLAFEIGRRGAQVVGADFAAPMLDLAREKARGRRAPVRWVRADALRLPFAKGSFDLAAVAFGIRNLEDPRAGLRECARVLRPGGRLAILEFFPAVQGLWGALFRFYFHRVLPRWARLFRSGRTGAYDYLPRSVTDFARPEELHAWMAEAGFVALGNEAFSGGIARLLTGTKAG